MNEYKVRPAKPLETPICLQERGRKAIFSRLQHLLETMRVFLVDSIRNKNIVDTLSKERTDVYRKQAEDAYHQALKNNALPYLVADTTLEHMQAVLNNKTYKKTVTRYTLRKDENVKEVEEYEELMDKLDTVMERLDDLQSTTENSSASYLSDKYIEEYIAQPNIPYPFSCLLYKLDTIVTKLKDITLPLVDSKSEKLSQQKRLDYSSGNESLLLAESLDFSKNVQPGKKQKDRCMRKMKIHLRKMFPKARVVMVEKNIDVSKPLLISSVLKSESLNFVLSGNFDNLEPVFQVHKRNSSTAYKHFKRNSNSRYTNRKRLRISVVVKLLKQNTLPDNNESCQIDLDSELKPHRDNVYSLNKSVSRNKLSRLNIFISGEYIKDEENEKYLPAVSIELKQNEDGGKEKNFITRSRSNDKNRKRTKSLTINSLQEEKEINKPDNDLLEIQSVVGPVTSIDSKKTKTIEIKSYHVLNEPNFFSNMYKTDNELVEIMGETKNKKHKKSNNSFKMLRKTLLAEEIASEYFFLPQSNKEIESEIENKKKVNGNFVNVGFDRFVNKIWGKFGLFGKKEGETNASVEINKGVENIEGCGARKKKKKHRTLNICENPIFGQFENFFITYNL